MKAVWLDCSSGASGDMILGALFDLGADHDAVRRTLGRMRLPAWSWRISRVRRAGFRALRVDVRPRAMRHGATREGAKARHARHGLVSWIAGAAGRTGLPAPAAKRGAAIMRGIIRAEAAVHGRSVHHVHLHEIEDVDTVVDVFGCLLALEDLGVGRVFASMVATGSGRVRSAHGLLPVPAPATAELLRGRVVRLGSGDGELATPTGAAIVAGLAEGAAPPPMRLLRVGCGAGARETADRPNIVRAFLGEIEGGVELPPGEPGAVCQLDAVVDDTSPQLVEAFLDRAYRDGALEAWTSHVSMKRNRPGTAFTVLAPEGRLDAMVRAFIEETGTIGVRVTRPGRVRLDRRVVRLRTRWGMLTFKVAGTGSAMHAIPEWREVRRLADKARVPARFVLEEARGLWRRFGGPPHR